MKNCVLAQPNEVNDFISEFEKLVPEGSQLYGEELLSGVGADRLISEIFSAALQKTGGIVEFFLILLGVGLLFAVCDISGELFGERLHSAARAGVAAVSALLIFSKLESLVFSVGESLASLSDFFSALIPLVTGISLASGAVGTAAVEAFNMNLALSVIGKISSDFLMPTVFMIFALALTTSIGDGGAAKLAKGAKSVFLWGLGIISFVLIVSVSMQTFLASSRDSAAMRAAKYALSGSIPIVGSTVSGALSTLMGALSEASAVVGVGAVAVIFTMAAAPVAVMLLYRLALSVSIWLFEFIGSLGAVGSFSAFRAALDALISIYAVSAVIYILEITVFIKGGTRVFV